VKPDCSREASADIDDLIAKALDYTSNIFGFGNWLFPKASTDGQAYEGIDFRDYDGANLLLRSDRAESIEINEPKSEEYAYKAVISGMASVGYNKADDCA